MTLGSPTNGYWGVYGPAIHPYTTAGKRHSAHAWVYITARTNGGVQLVAADASTLIPFAWSQVAVATDQWTKIALTGLDCSAHANGVVLAVVSAPDWIAGQPYWGTPWYTNLTFYVDAFGFGESDSAIGDVLYSGGTALWQRANVVLGAISDIVTGYTVSLADLARLDGSAWADEPLLLGGGVEISDTDLNVVTTQRVVDLEQDLLNPLSAAIQLQTPETQLTKMLAGGAIAGGSSVQGSSSAVTLGPQSASALGITDVYTKAEIDALLALYPLLDGTRQFTGPVGISVGAEGFSIGKVTYSSSGQADVSIVDVGPPGQNLRTMASANLEILWVVGFNGTTDIFCDLVIAETYTGSANAVLSNSVVGAPGARNYGITAGVLHCGIAGAGTKTYLTRVAAINTHI
jgi:hypothetical protein